MPVIVLGAKPFSTVVVVNVAGVKSRLEQQGERNGWGEKEARVGVDFRPYWRRPGYQIYRRAMNILVGVAFVLFLLGAGVAWLIERL